MAVFHNADVDISNSSFKNSGSKYGLNIKYGLATIENSIFTDNSSGGIGADFVPKETVVRNNKFYNNDFSQEGSAINLSWSDFKTENNYIQCSADKGRGITVNENSKPTIKNNTIEQCDIGIVVKNSSVVEIIGNKISQARIGIDVFREKQVFGGGIANLYENILKDVRIDYSKDNLSEINILK
jgi:parallel beta-helix repeat protein